MNMEYITTEYTPLYKRKNYHELIFDMTRWHAKSIKLEDTIKTNYKKYEKTISDFNKAGIKLRIMDHGTLNTHLTMIKQLGIENKTKMKMILIAEFIINPAHYKNELVNMIKKEYRQYIKKLKEKEVYFIRK